MPKPEIDTVVPWEFRLALLLPIPALATGALIALFLLTIFVCFSWALGHPLLTPDEALTKSARDSAFLVLLTGYLFAALKVGAAGIERDLGRGGVEDRPGIGELPKDLIRRSRYVGAIGIAIGFLLISALGELWGYAMTAPWTTLHETSFMLWLLLLVSWVIARTAVFTISGSRSAAEATAQEIEVDLLDLQPLSAFGRIGLRFALLWIVGVAIAAPPLLGPRLELAGVLAPFAGACAIATLALLIPVLGVHRQIRATKQAELRHIAAAITGDEGAIAKTRIALWKHPPSLADLIAYRSMIESTREWPYDASTLFRFVLYLLIPLASWIAAAFVERVVDAALR